MQLLKGHLVANATLAQLSQRYGLPSRLLAEPSAVWNLRNGEGTQANLFEAYLAGLYTSYLRSYAESVKLEVDYDVGARALEQPGAVEEARNMSDMAHERAFGRVSKFVQELFLPIAAWGLEELKAAHARLEAATVQDDEEADIDRLALGATARVNEHFIKLYKHKPAYESQPAGGRWMVRATAEGPPGTV